MKSTIVSPPLIFLRFISLAFEFWNQRPANLSLGSLKRMNGWSPFRFFPSIPSETVES